ncbi:putative methyltransferase [Raoultella planticola]|uniref:Putative methyltransferase n=1 Tax=Raoultella planticola TaxID=575 RepID=A0A485C1Y4_RAOPL|nr:putative methyltransferase [Raoultella planticola]
MSDELKNKSGKVKVMYVRSDDDSDRRTHNPRTGKGGGRPGKSRVDGRSRPARDERNSRGDDRKRDDRNAMISIVIALLRGVPSRVHQTMMRR